MAPLDPKLLRHRKDPASEAVNQDAEDERTVRTHFQQQRQNIRPPPCGPKFGCLVHPGFIHLLSLRFTSSGRLWALQNFISPSNGLPKMRFSLQPSERCRMNYPRAIVFEFRARVFRASLRLSDVTDGFRGPCWCQGVSFVSNINPSVSSHQGACPCGIAR